MQVLSTIPSQNGTNIGLNDTITITFDTAVDATTVDDSSIAVFTKKTSIVKVENGLEQPEGIFASDNFFADGLTGMVTGNVSVVGSTITFIPKFNYQPDTIYNVTISSGIAGTDASLLSKINYFKFTTAAEDMVMQSLPNIPVGLTSIIGTDFVIKDTPVNSSFYVKSSSPKNDSFLVINNKITATFNKDIATNTASNITILRYDLFSDAQPIELLDTIDWSSVVSASKVTITLNTGSIKNNCIYEVIIDSATTAIDGDVLKEDFHLSFISSMSQYYSSTKLVRLKAGTVLSAITDISLAMMIYYSSIEVDELLYGKSLSGRTRAILRSKYVMYATIGSALTNNYDFGLSDYINKKLSEFSLAVSNKPKIAMYNLLIKESKDFKKTFSNYLNLAVSKGYAKRNNTPNDIGRLWNRNAKPGLNTKVPNPYNDNRMVDTWGAYGV